MALQIYCFLSSSGYNPEQVKRGVRLSRGSISSHTLTQHSKSVLSSYRPTSGHTRSSSIFGTQGLNDDSPERVGAWVRAPVLSLCQSLWVNG
eukprot:3560126-Amphidinium_carterae.1